MSVSVFFTAEDPRDLPRGSRDPLRYLPVWTNVARDLIPFLTTVTPSYRGFLTRLLFHGAIENLQPSLANASIDAQWEAFCCFEQLCAVVRTECEPATPWLPGSSTVAGRLEDGMLTVGKQSSYWLSKSQRNTGYWGYYHRATVGSGILRLNNHDRPGYVLTEEAREVFRTSSYEKIISNLRGPLSKVLALGKEPARVRVRDFTQLANLFAEEPEPESKAGRFWQDRLLLRAPADGEGELQQEFAVAVKRIYAESNDRRSYDVWETLSNSENQSRVAHHASRVRDTEAVIGLTEWVFDACRMMHEDGSTLDRARQWAVKNGYSELWLTRLRALNPPRDPDLARLRDLALEQSNSFVPLAQELLQRHARVMRNRGGAAWVAYDTEGNLRIGQPCEAPATPDFERFPSGVRWRYDYFLYSWLTIADEIGFLPKVDSDA